MSILETVVKYLKQDGWNFGVDGNRIKMNVSAGGHVHVVDVFVNEDTQLIVFALTYQRKTEFMRRQDMIQLMCTVNFKIALGGLEMDFRDGEVKFRNSVDVESLKLSKAFISNNLRMVASYGAKCCPAVYAVMDGKGVDEALELLSL